MARLHVVALIDSIDACDGYAKLAKAYGDENVFVLADGDGSLIMMVDSPSSDSHEVAEVAGIDEDCAGIVLRLARGYSGYMSGDFWEWLRKRYHRKPSPSSKPRTREQSRLRASI